MIEKVRNAQLKAKQARWVSIHVREEAWKRNGYLLLEASHGRNSLGVVHLATVEEIVNGCGIAVLSLQCRCNISTPLLRTCFEATANLLPTRCQPAANLLNEFFSPIAPSWLVFWLD
jgi:hypothetical protein